MRLGLYIPQQAIVEKDLLGKVPTDGWLLLDYLRRWVTCKNVRKQQVQGRQFFWIKYSQACRELPILFPHGPVLRTQINKMVRLVALLKRTGLIDTHRFASRCYIHITERAQELYLKPTTEAASRFNEHGIASTNDDVDVEKHDGPVMRNRDVKEQYQKEQDRKEQYYTQNRYSDEQLECVKHQLETIFPKRNWSHSEIVLLRRQMPIPKWELTLIRRFYALTNCDLLPGNKLTEHEFLLTRRRKTMHTLLYYWGDEVGRAQCFFFRSFAGAEEARRRGWDLREMQPPQTTP